MRKRPFFGSPCPETRRDAGDHAARRQPAQFRPAGHRGRGGRQHRRRPAQGRARRPRRRQARRHLVHHRPRRAARDRHRQATRRRSRSSATPPRTCWRRRCSSCSPRRRSRSARSSRTASTTTSPTSAPSRPRTSSAIEAKMARARRRRTCQVERREMPRDEAVAFFQNLGEHYKAEIIASIPSNEPICALRPGRLGRPLPRPARAVHRQAARPSS